MPYFPFLGWITSLSSSDSNLDFFYYFKSDSELDNDSDSLSDEDEDEEGEAIFFLPLGAVFDFLLDGYPFFCWIVGLVSYFLG